jgi:hypothetical protein
LPAALRASGLLWSDERDRGDRITGCSFRGAAVFL